MSQGVLNRKTQAILNFVETFLDEVQWFISSSFTGLMEGSIRKVVVDTVISLIGSGSIPNDLEVIANKKPVQADKVHVVGFGERQGFAN